MSWLQRWWQRLRGEQVTPASPTPPRQHTVTCASVHGLHRMAYHEWGDAANPRVLVCVHGLTRMGQDFSPLAEALQHEYRVVAVDVAGRGDSDWLSNPALYGVPQYVADMVTLIARLNVPSVDWFGTSMGGLIGMALAGLPKSPIRRLVLNDVGPRLALDSLARIGSYAGKDPRFDTQQQGLDYLREISASFGRFRDAEWRALNAPMLREDGQGRWRLHYDPRIADAFAALNAVTLPGFEHMLWQAYDAIKSPTLLLRGAESDLLTRSTAEEMTMRGPRARLIEYPDCGHAPMLRDASQITPVRDFLLHGQSA